MSVKRQRTSVFIPSGKSFVNEIWKASIICDADMFDTDLLISFNVE